MFNIIKKSLFVFSVILTTFSLSQTSLIASSLEEIGETDSLKKSVNFKPLDSRVPINKQLEIYNEEKENVSSVILVNVFTVDPDDADKLVEAWENDGNWMKKQPGFISTQLHKGIAGSSVFLNYAIWESIKHFKAAFTNPEFQSKMSAYPSSAVTQPHLFKRVAVPNLCTK